MRKKRREKAHFWELHVRHSISWTLYKLNTSDLAYSARYNQYVILHYQWLKVKNKLFSRAKNVKKFIFWNPNSTSYFSDTIWPMDFETGLFDSLWSTLDVARNSKWTEFTLIHGFPKRITNTEHLICDKNAILIFAVR